MNQQGSRLTQTCKTPEPLLSIKTNMSCCTSQLQLDLAMECLSCKTCLHLPAYTVVTTRSSRLLPCDTEVVARQSLIPVELSISTGC